MDNRTSADAGQSLSRVQNAVCWGGGWLHGSLPCRYTRLSRALGEPGTVATLRMSHALPRILPLRLRATGNEHPTTTARKQGCPQSWIHWTGELAIWCVGRPVLPHQSEPAGSCPVRVRHKMQLRCAFWGWGRGSGTKSAGRSCGMLCLRSTLRGRLMLLGRFVHMYTQTATEALVPRTFHVHTNPDFPNHVLFLPSCLFQATVPYSCQGCTAVLCCRRKSLRPPSCLAPK